MVVNCTRSYRTYTLKKKNRSIQQFLTKHKIAVTYFGLFHIFFYLDKILNSFTVRL